MKKNHFTILFLSLLIASWSTQGQSKKWTLQECVDYALKNNISIQQTGLETETAAVNKTAAFGSFLPTINASTSHSWNIGLNQNITTGLLENQTSQFTAAGVNVNVTLYNGLQNLNRMRKANLSILAAQYRLSKIQNDISLNVANAYLQILFSKENLKVQQNQLLSDEKQFNRTTELVDAGVIPKGDLLDSKATISGDKQKIIIAENSLFLGKLSLAQLLQLPDFENFDVSDNNTVLEKSTVLNEKPETIIEKAKAERMEIKIAKNNLAIAEKDIQIAKGAYQPNLSAFYGFNTRISDNPRVTGAVLDAQNPTRVIGVDSVTGANVIVPNFNPTFGGPVSFFSQFNTNKGNNFGLQLSIPILNGFSSKTSVQRAKIALKQSKIASKQAELDIERNVYTAMSDAKGALNAYESSIVAFEARKEALNYAKEKFAVGLMNSFNLNQAQTIYSAAESEVLRTKFDYIFKVKVVEFYFGIPISKK